MIYSEKSPVAAIITEKSYRELLHENQVHPDAAHAALGGSIHRDYLHAPGLRIAGGTDEILKNIIAERILGLPAERRADKDVPFKDLPGR